MSDQPVVLFGKSTHDSEATVLEIKEHDQQIGWLKKMHGIWVWAYNPEYIFEHFRSDISTSGFIQTTDENPESTLTTGSTGDK